MKIKNVTIQSFRGIPDSITANFTDGITPVSTIIYGDNGSGKSSIIDAIEFVLQGRINRSQKIFDPRVASVISLRNNKTIPSRVSCLFADETEYVREILVEKKCGETVTKISHTACHPNFENVPFVLRRSDIITYGSIEEEKRMTLFMHFLYKLSPSVYLKDDPVIAEKRHLRSHEKQIRSQLIEQFNEFLGIDCETHDFYYTNEEFEKYVRNHVSKEQGLKNKKGEKKYYFPYTIYKRIHELKHQIFEKNDEVQRLNKEIEELTKAVRPEKKSIEITANFLNRASTLLTESFNSVSELNYIKSIELRVQQKTGASLNIVLNLVSGRKTTPKKILSEANYDLLILLLYISFIRVAVEQGQEKLIILDDVFQSVDTTIRTKCMSYLISKMKGWQIILTVHDKLWLNQLRYIFQQNAHRVKELHLQNWSFETGPQVVEKRFYSYDTTLEDALKTNNRVIIASMAGVLLEKICNTLSMEIGISIHRNIDDKYTIGELWPGIYKEFKSTPLVDLATKINNSVYIRNYIGCHYNEWSNMLSDEEILKFANNISELYKNIYCRKCCSWIKRDMLPHTFRCKCGDIRIPTPQLDPKDECLKDLESEKSANRSK